MNVFKSISMSTKSITALESVYGDLSQINFSQVVDKAINEHVDRMKAQKPYSIKNKGQFDDRDIYGRKIQNK